jgi:hypothetical protein
MSYIGNPIISTDFPKDTFSGNGSTTAFTMSIAPASVNAVIVVVSGITQDPSTYTISGTTLTFSGAPPTGTSNISVRHLGVAGIPNTPSAGSVVTSSIADASVTQAKLGTNVAGTGPAFSAWLSSQSVTQDTNARMSFNNEFFDTASCYNNTGSTVDGIPAYAFLPNVAGYYQVNVNCLWLSYTYSGSANSYVALSLFKNNSGFTEYSRPNFVNGNTGGSSIIYLNGTTDYITTSWYASNGGCTLVGNNGSYFSNFSAVLVKAA